MIASKFLSLMPNLSLLQLNLQVGMEFWARWAHRALWHASLWHMHKVGYLWTNYQLVTLRSEAAFFFSFFFPLPKVLHLGILQSHHRPRHGPFELNDIIAVINAVPAIALLSYGVFNKGIVPGLCFGAVLASSFSL